MSWKKDRKDRKAKDWPRWDMEGVKPLAEKWKVEWILWQKEWIYLKVNKIKNNKSILIIIPRWSKDKHVKWAKHTWVQGRRPSPRLTHKACKGVQTKDSRLINGIVFRKNSYSRGAFLQPRAVTNKQLFTNQYI